ncbi:MAG TPA: hypothetical protein VHC97_13280 [Thermoanaerobaculia bacterium]|jgi:hypothetical protein|nr:hypothetical protein [Thermoanaerobaculia bacterium]
MMVRKLFCLALPLAILAPMCLALAVATDHYCACGMKKGECFCALAAHRKGGHCDMQAGAAEGARCLMHSHKPVDGNAFRLPLDLRDRLGVFGRQDFNLAPDVSETVAVLEEFPPSFLPAPPEPPPPRNAFPLS